MIKPIAALAVFLAVAACNGNPFAAIIVAPANPAIPPGTTSPAAAVSIFRYEPFDAATGSGFAESISYDSINDRFFVDNLAFDGDNFYERDNVVPSLGPFQVYENDNFLNDPRTGTPISQLSHKAIRGVSTTGNTEFAIVRTGAYVNYGFGGFIYQRNNNVVLPTTGQAVYNGQYAGLRDFLGRGGLEYTTANMMIAIDFEDLNNGDAVRGEITNRRVFDLAGTDITASVIAAINADPVYGPAIAALPTLFFTIEPGVLDANGELLGSLQSTLLDANGTLITFESGSYYAIVSGANADEIVGVVVIAGNTPNVQGATTRETGGFIVYR